jgi:hypothetical protein
MATIFKTESTCCQLAASLFFLGDGFAYIPFSYTPIALLIHMQPSLDFSSLFLTARDCPIGHRFDA